jgi:hypothetical protein
MSKLTKIYNHYYKHPFSSQKELEQVFEAFSKALKRALEDDCLAQGLELAKFVCGDFKIEAFIHNPETNVFVYVYISGLRGGFCLALNNVHYKQEDGVDFPRGGFWCQCAPLTDLVERVKALTER